MAQRGGASTPPRRPARILCRSLIFLAGLFLFAAAVPAAETAGKILTSQGVTTLQRAGAPGRITGAGETLQVGDVLTTGPGSIAMIELGDGSRMTLRPGTIFTVEKFSTQTGNESATLRLFKGGMRAITGFLSKRNPNAVQVKAQTATIGIRGTDFDARLCSGKECSSESRLAGEKVATASSPAASAPALPVIARLAMVKGKAEAVGAGGARRPLVSGDPLHSGETVETGAASMVVIAFADQTRVTLQADSHFKIDEFRFKSAGEKDSSILSLAKGAMRMFTGLIGKANPRDVKLTTRVATIGIRGTGLDAVCTGLCAMPNLPGPTGSPPGPPPTPPAGGAPSGLFVHTWQGAVSVTTPQGSLNLPAGSTGFVGAPTASPTLLPTLPAFMRNNPAPRPDTIRPPPPGQFGASPAGTPPVAGGTPGTGSSGTPPGSSAGAGSGSPPGAPGSGGPTGTPPAGTPGSGPTGAPLAGGSPPPANGEGLHVWVREGQVTLQQAGQTVALGAGQAAYAGPAINQTPVVLAAPPVFMRLDPTPLPTPQTITTSGSATLSKPGTTSSSSCEIR